MEIKIKKHGNGICSVLTLEIIDPELIDLKFIEKIILNVEEYNKEQVDLA